MDAAQSQNELTSTIHLGVRGVTDNSPAKTLAELISILDGETKKIVEEILNSDNEKAMLVIARGPQRGSRFLITTDGVTIGRSPESAIFLDDVTVSRSHAQIKSQESGKFLLVDNSSLNGTYLNNNSVESSSLVSGDEIQIGKFHFVFISSAKK